MADHRQKKAPPSGSTQPRTPVPDHPRPEAGVYEMVASQPGVKHPERYVLGKPHPNRAKQFKPFAALRGYEELVAQVMAEANEPHDFAGIEETC